PIVLGLCRGSDGGLGELCGEVRVGDRDGCLEILQIWSMWLTGTCNVNPVGLNAPCSCMQTRSSLKFVGESSTNLKRRNRRCSKQRVEPITLEEVPVVTMADQRTMAKLLRAPTEGYAEAIIVPPILAENFELKHSLINLDVPETSIKLMLFPFSIDVLAWIWLDKEPPHSILTWDNLDLFRTCPHHGFIELQQLDTFYNGLNPSDQDSLNSTAGGNLLERSTQDALKIIENKSRVWNSRNKPIVSQMKASNVDSSKMAKLTDAVTQVTSIIATMMKQIQAPASAFIKAVKESCVTCGGAHSYRQCPATDGNTFTGYNDNIQGYVLATAVNNKYNQGYGPQGDPHFRASHQMGPPGFPLVQNNQNRFNQNLVVTQSDFQAYMKANDVVMKNMQTQMSSLTNSNIVLKSMFGQFMKRNTASSSSSGSLPSNTVANPREDLKAITTRSGVTLAGPSFSPPPSKEVDQELETIMDQPKPTIPYSSRANKQKLREKDDNLALKFVEIFRDLHFELSFTDALLHMPKFALMFKSLMNNKEKLFDLATNSMNENCSKIILKKLPEKLVDPGKKLSLPELTPTQMILELADQSTTRPVGIVEDVFVKVGKFHFPTDFVVDDYVVDPGLPLILERPFLRIERALIDVYGKELTLRVDDEALTFKVGQTLKYSYNDAELINRIDVIDVSCEEYV
nr:hypothetical protein [Tanacetum cinerariifolium]